MKVRAPKGLKCPMEGSPRDYITDAEEGVEVPNTSYYRRLVDDKSLEIVPDQAPAKVKPGQAGGGES